jgi:hypothetical protein
VRIYEDDDENDWRGAYTRSTHTRRLAYSLAGWPQRVASPYRDARTLYSTQERISVLFERDKQ